MNLIPVDRHELELDVPLHWMLYDRDGNILLEAGTKLESLDDIDALLALGPMRDTEEGVVLPLEPTEQKVYSFSDMRLRVGDRLQIEPPATVSTDRHTAKVIGWVDNFSLLVSTPTVGGLRVPFRDGDKVVVRMFTNQNAFAFNTDVMRGIKIPLDYLHLTFPTEIQGAVIRKSPRIRMRLITTVSPLPPEGNTPLEQERFSAILLNISADGTLIQAKQALTEKGGRLRLAFRVNLHDVDALLTVNAVVRSVFAEEGKVGVMLHGVQFEKLEPNDQLILQSMIYQKMVEQPQLLV
ncbi:MAG TPA: flagellar brake protein [Rhodocyclaceae bacterium]|jgi:c-di-GMP-binding flagellar brake protein YcgR